MVSSWGKIPQKVVLNMRVKKTLTLDESVLERIQSYADTNGLSLSGSVSVLCMQKLDEIKALNEIANVQRLLSEVGNQIENLQANPSDRA